jgi:hypothetical protein
MTIDERLERLTERHEALTQTVEIIAGIQRENERLHEKAYQENEEAHRKNEVLLGHVIESIDSLARIAHAHEQRISGIEDRRE